MPDGPAMQVQRLFRAAFCGPGGGQIKSHQQREAPGGVIPQQRGAQVGGIDRQAIAARGALPLLRRMLGELEERTWTAPALDTNPSDSHPTFVGKVDTSIASGAGGL